MSDTCAAALGASYSAARRERQAAQVTSAPMRMKQKVLLFYATSFIALFGALFIVISQYGPRSAAVLALALVWAGGVGTLQFVCLRCPSCHKVAVHKPSGAVSPFVGDQCRHCGGRY